MVVFQVGLAVVVLFAAGLLGRTLQQLQKIDTGFATDHVAILELSWPEKKFSSPALVAAFYDRLLSRLQVLPDVASAAPVNVAPFTGATGGWDGSFVADRQPGKAPVFNMAVVGADYFDTLGIGLRRGRTFNDADREGSPPVAIVSERAARLLWPGEDAVGKRLRFGDSTGAWRTVVGVAPETRYRAIREPAPTVYLPVRQFLDVFPLVRTMAVRTHGSPSAALPSIRRAVQLADKDVSVLGISGMSDLVAGEFATPRLNALLVGVFGAGAVLLAAVGLHAVLAGVVKERRRELAIRHAVGATPGRLRAIVLGQALAMCAGGVTLGLAASLGGARLLDSVLYGVAGNDARTIAGVVALLAAIAIPACYVPARQATKADTMELLRQE
jgi:predicted permease